MRFKQSEALATEAFREMDYKVVGAYGLPIELMMENAGLVLAQLIRENVDITADIVIGAGNGNNGGGGLVAARRLAGWGYKVFLDIPSPISRSLPKMQLKRAHLFGVKPFSSQCNPRVWVDAYLGFSQRVPLAATFSAAIKNANAAQVLRIALDLPTGILEKSADKMFKPDIVLTLAAPKLVLNVLSAAVRIYIADIGIPKKVYEEYNIEMPEFYGQHYNKR